MFICRNIEQLTANAYKLRSGLDNCSESSPIIRLICEVAEETGFTIGTLHDLQKINELKDDQRFSDACNSSIVKEFYKKIWDRIRTMMAPANSDEEPKPIDMLSIDGGGKHTPCDELRNCHDIYSRLVYFINGIVKKWLSIFV